MIDVYERETREKRAKSRAAVTAVWERFSYLCTTKPLTYLICPLINYRQNAVISQKGIAAKKVNKENEDLKQSPVKYYRASPTF